MEIQQKSLKKNAFLNVIKTLMGLLFPLITFPYASRILLPEGIGKVNFAQTIVSYFSIIAMLGIHTYGIREAAKLRDDKIKLSQFVKELFTINIIATVFAYCLFAFSLFVVPKFSEYRILLCVCSATILFTTLGMEWLYTAIEDFVYITIRSIAFQIISLILLFTLVHTKDDYLKYAGISVFSNVGANVLNFVHSRKYLSFRNLAKSELKKHWKPIFVFFVMSVTISIYTLLDTTMLGFICGDYQVGIYSASTKINKVVLSLVAAVGTVLLPRLSYYIGKNDNEDFKKLAYKGFDILLLFAVPCCVGLSVLSEPVVLLLSGEKYSESIVSMRVMNPIIIAIGLSNFIGIQMFMPLGKEKCTLYSVLFGAVVNFSLNLIFIPKFYSLGAAISTVCAESIVTIVQFVFLRRFIQIGKILINLFKYGLNSLIMGTVVYFSIFCIRDFKLKILIGLFSGILVYSILLLVQRNKLFFEVCASFSKKLKREEW